MTTRTNPLSVSEPWDRVADGYAAESGVMTAQFSDRALELARLEPTARVLDVASGSGALALVAATRAASVVAVDFAEAMNEQLRNEARARGITNLRVLRADGQALPLQNESFDAGFSMFGWMFFPDRPRGLAELMRVLVPGAQLVVSTWAPVTRVPLMAAMFGALRAADETMPEPRYDPDSLENPDRLAAELRDAGFADVAVHDHTIPFAFKNADELWARMVRMSAPLSVLRDRLGEERWAESSQVALAYLRRELGGEPRSLTTTAWLGVARRPA